MPYNGHCLLCEKAETPGPICPECRQKETTPAGGPLVPKVLTNPEALKLFHDAYQKVWTELKSRDTGAPIEAVQQFIESIAAGMIITCKRQGHDPLIIWHTLTQNIRVLVLQNLDELGEDSGNL